jgi:hypothetical protein
MSPNLLPLPMWCCPDLACLWVERACCGISSALARTLQCMKVCVCVCVRACPCHAAGTQKVERASLAMLMPNWRAVLRNFFRHLELKEPQFKCACRVAHVAHVARCL